MGVQDGRQPLFLPSQVALGSAHPLAVATGGAVVVVIPSGEPCELSGGSRGTCGRPKLGLGQADPAATQWAHFCTASFVLCPVPGTLVCPPHQPNPFHPPRPISDATSGDICASLHWTHRHSSSSLPQTPALSPHSPSVSPAAHTWSSCARPGRGPGDTQTEQQHPQSTRIPPEAQWREGDRHQQTSTPQCDKNQVSGEGVLSLA